MKITQAVISAGGFGTRLKPYTDTVPKPMLTILGKPILEWHLEQCKKHGITDIFLTLHHLPDVVRHYFGDGSRFGVQVRYLVEENPLGSAGALKILEPGLNDLFFYTYGDMASLMDYTKMASAYALKKDPIGMQRVERTDEYADADVAELDADARFTAIHKKPHGNARYPGAYRMRGTFILDKKILSYLPVGAECDLPKDILPQAVADGKNFYGYECNDYSKGIDTLEKWHEAEAELTRRGITPWW